VAGKIFVCTRKKIINKLNFQIAIFSAETATKFDLLRAAFSIVGLGFCIPLIGVLLLLLPALAVLKAFASATLSMKAAYTAGVAALPFALTWWISRLHRVRLD
jgi:hypothetical protein